LTAAGPGGAERSLFVQRPRMWGQGLHGRGGRVRNATNDIGEVCFGIKAPAAGVGGDGVDDGALLFGFSRAEEEKVLFANRAGADSIFNQIVVDFVAAVVQIGLLAAKGVAGMNEGFAKGAFGEVSAVPPGDIREMASALRRLIINPRLRREFGAFNQERFQEKYTLLAYQQRWLAWMQRCS
jgi:hypothetical protein